MVEHLPFGGARRVSRRRLLTGAAALAGAAGLGLAGCGRSGTSGTPAVGATGSPQRGGTLRIPLTAEPIAPAFDMGTQAAAAVGTAGIATLAYNGLVEVEGGEVVPELAESWDQESPTRYVFELRRDVEFHDGTPFDADAVKANFDRLLDPDGDGVNRPPFLETVEVLGSHQVAMNLSRPSASFLGSLRRGRVMMMSPTAVAQYADSDPFRASVGTGPFIFAEYRPGTVVRLERNDNYWAEDNYLDEIVFSIIPETNTQLVAFRNGDFEMIGLVPSQVSQVQGDGVLLHEDVGNTFNYLSFNQAISPFADREVRRAFSAAIDREGIAAGVYNGFALPAHGPFSTAIGAAYEDLSTLGAQSYSPEEAQELLSRSGYDLDAAVAFNAFTQSPWAEEADAITAQLEQLGVSVDLNKEDFGSWADRIYSALDFTLMNSGQTTRTVDPDEVIYPLVHSEGDLNVFGIEDERLDGLLDEAREQSEPGLRAEMYHEIARIVAEEAYVAFTVYPTNLVATSDRVGGYQFNPGGTHSAARCWLAS